MACVLVPTAEAIVVTAVAAVMKSKEKKRREALRSAQGENYAEKEGFSKKLFWLAYLLWGGAILLIFEHMWHGEIVPWFPFLTAAASPESTAEMLEEMATVGVTMAVLVTAVWGAMVAISYAIEKRVKREKEERSI